MIIQKSSGAPDAAPASRDDIADRNSPDNHAARQSEMRPGTTTSAKPDFVLYPDARPDDSVLEEDLTQHMIRRPTEADFADVLSPEGNSGDIVGSDVSDSTQASNASLGGVT